MRRIKINLARREKLAILAAGCFVGIILVMYAIVLPVLSSKTRLKRAIEVDEKRLEEVLELSVEYEDLRAKPGGIQNALSQREKGFTLFSLLEKLAGQVGLKDQIKYIKPSSSETKGPYKVSSVEMQFEGITMGQLFNYLYRVEDPTHVISIKRMALKGQKDNTGYVDATLQISTVQPS